MHWTLAAMSKCFEIFLYNFPSILFYRVIDYERLLKSFLLIAVCRRLYFMENQSNKLQRNINLIKGFMAVVVFFLIFNVVQTGTLAFSVVASTVAFLSFLRGVILSPLLLLVPFKNWFGSNALITNDSLRYFLLAAVLVIISSL